MRLKLDCVFAEADSYGKVKREKKWDTELLVEMVDGMEIEGICFNASLSEKGVEIVMEGEGLSGEIRPNYNGKVGSSVFQVGFKKEGGRRTANVLDRFLRKVNKMLVKAGEDCNILLVKDVEVLDD